VQPRAAVGGYSDAELVEQIRLVLAATAFFGEGYRKVWAKLRHRGVRTSRARVLRLMREHGLRAPTHSSRVRGPRSHEGTIIPAAPDLRWGTDLTGTWTTQEGGVSVMLTVDHHTAEILGIHAAKRATRWEALEPLRQAVRRCFGNIRANVASGLELRHDHGSQYISADFQNEIGFLGIASSPAFVRARRASDPHPQGTTAVGQDLRDRRGIASGVAAMDRAVQRTVAHRASRLQGARPTPARVLRRKRKDGRMNDPINRNRVSRKPLTATPHKNSWQAVYAILKPLSHYSEWIE